MRKLIATRTCQHGVVLVTLFLLLFAVGAALFLSSVNTHAVEMRRFNDVRAEMENAKRALIAYAMNYPNLGYDYVDNSIIQDEGPGRLLCPDVDNDGLADSNTTDCTDNVRGRLPEQYVYGSNRGYINDAFADNDQQFWYVVSPAFKEIATTTVNDTTAGTLSIDGKSGYVAVIIAPGIELSFQDRAAGPTTASNYLEQGNLSGTSFINSYSDSTVFNDQVIGITALELKLEAIKGGNPASVPSVMYENTRQAMYAYYMEYGVLPSNATTINTYSKNNDLGWRFDEGYLNLATGLQNFYYNSGYPYVRYNLNGCTTYWYWFIPVAPYSPNNTYVSGTAC